MATIKLGAIVTDISGKVGGQSFGKGSSGNYLKNNGAMANKATQSQNAQRVQTANVSRMWANLTPTQKASYEAGVVDYPYINKVGDTKYLSGFNLFCKLTQQLIFIQEPLNPTLPAFEAIQNVTMQFDSISIGTVKISALSGYSSSMNYQIYATPPLSQGIANPRKYFKRIGLHGSSMNTGFFVEPEYNAVFGEMKAGNFIYFGVKVSVVSTGYTSATYTSIISAVMT